MHPIKLLIIISLCLLCNLSSLGQLHNLLGTVHNSKLEPIPYINVYVKKINRGAKTDEQGQFVIPLAPGRYEIVFTGIGYKPMERILIIQEQDLEQDFLMSESNLQISEVTISSKRKDKSKEIIRNLIREKKNIQSAVLAYTFEAYIKANITNENKPTSEKEKPSRSNKSKKDSVSKAPPEASNQFAEVLLKVSKSFPNKIKEERSGVNIKGDKQQFFYLSCTEGDFNFYDNLINIRKLGKVSFLSPFSLSGLAVYRYKYLKAEFIDGKMYHHIKFRPSTTSNALLTGEVWIQDETWVIKRIITSFPKAHTPEYRDFQIEANYTHVNNKVWLPNNYIFDYTTTEKLKGNTLVNFKNYNIDTTFRKKNFNNELSATSQQAYEQDSNFWNQIRPVPLTQLELKTIRYKDSIYDLTHSDKYRDSVEQDHNKIRFLNIVWHGQSNENWRKERYMQFPSLVDVINPFNLASIGGPRIAFNFNYKKEFENKKKLILFPNISYGPWNKDVRGRFTGYYLFNPFSRSALSVNVGRQVSNLFWQDALINLFDRSNYYLKDNLTIGLRRELINGLFISNTVEMGHRRSMHNYITNSYIDSILYDGRESKPIFFEDYTAFFNELELSFTPHQKYIREPHQKLILGSRYPTFYAKWRKGIPGILKSKIQYDYIELGMTQDLNLGTIGITTYNLKYGNFIREGNVEPIDYKFIARGNPFILFNPINSFQAMDSTFALFKGFGEGHLVHEFNGALINKIPFVRRLKLFESAGTGLLLAPERKLAYIEAFAGIEKSFVLFRQPLKFGVWGVASYANQFKNPLQLKFSIRVYDFQSDTWN